VETPTPAPPPRRAPIVVARPTAPAHVDSTAAAPASQPPTSVNPFVEAVQQDIREDRASHKQ
jgi:hypothetical protein